MTAQATGRETTFAGLPAVELALPQGDTLRVMLHGAQTRIQDWWAQAYDVVLSH